MNKAEFTDRVIGLKYEDLSEEDFDAINMVYAWHPMIPIVNGKDEIADLYKKGGMGIIKNMLPTAHELQMHEGNLQKNTVAMERLEKEHKRAMEELRNRQMSEMLTIKNDNISANDRIREINREFNV